MPERVVASRQLISGPLRLILLSCLGLTLAVQAALPVAASGVSINGGGSTDTMTRFGIGIKDGRGHFECLMPGIMTVEATVTSATLTSTGADFKGVATVTLAQGTPFGHPGRMAVDVPFTASVTAGGPRVGMEDLKILGMDFPGTVEHGQINIGF